MQKHKLHGSEANLIPVQVLAPPFMFSTFFHRVIFSSLLRVQCPMQRGLLLRAREAPVPRLRARVAEDQGRSRQPCFHLFVPLGEYTRAQRRLQPLPRPPLAIVTGRIHSSVDALPYPLHYCVSRRRRVERTTKLSAAAGAGCSERSCYKEIWPNRYRSASLLPCMLGETFLDCFRIDVPSRLDAICFETAKKRFAGSAHSIDPRCPLSAHAVCPLCPQHTQHSRPINYATSF